MKDKVLIVFDDTNEKSEIICDVIGRKGFGDVIIKKRRLDSYFFDVAKNIFGDFEFIRIKSFFEFGNFINTLESRDEKTRVLHFFSNFAVSDVDKTALSLKKLFFIEKPYRAVAGDKTAALLFQSIKSYSEFLKLVLSEKSTFESSVTVEDCFEIEGLIDIGTVENFIQAIAENFDARYFNSLKGDGYTLVKSSTKKEKIKAEYTFYHLLPDDMKFWFVMPFNYEESGDKASYTMERLHTTDLAVKWVHGSIDAAEFRKILDKYFYFFRCRHSKPVSKVEYEEIANNLYESKVRSRIDDLKKLPEFENIANLMRSSCKLRTVDEVFDKYLLLKEKIESQNKYPPVSVIGHGDPCFANVLYNKSTELLKFIDPKGALNEEELWTNPYYDVAKLSHSVCGLYDFFNNALFDISINEDFQAELKINFDNSEYKKLFREKLEVNGFDYLTVRIYEASLFISMLPLHIDYPHKVLGFILNAIHIMEEIENELNGK